MAFNSENVHIYLELDVPQDDSNLNDYLEEYFNISTLVGQCCSDGCKKFNQMEKSLKITLVDYAQFFCYCSYKGSSKSRWLDIE